MRAVFLESDRSLVLRDVDMPACGPGDLLVKVEACTICGTDLKIREHGHARVKPPHVIGHEVAGIVVAVGKDVTGFAEGDRVALAPAGVSCRTCYYCRIGRDNLCNQRRSIGYEWAGGFAEYMLVPEPFVTAGNVQPIPETVAFAEAALAEPLACVMNCHGQMNLPRGITAAVLGAGPIGLMHAMAFKARGAARVFVIDISAARLEAMGELDGVTKIDGGREDVPAAIRNETDGIGVDAVVVAAPAAAAYRQALELVRKGGVVAYFSSLPRGSDVIALPMNVVHYHEITVIGTAGARVEHAREAVDLLASRAVAADRIVTDAYPLERIDEAFSVAAARMRGKVAVLPGR